MMTTLTMMIIIIVSMISPLLMGKDYKVNENDERKEVEHIFNCNLLTTLKAH